MKVGFSYFYFVYILYLPSRTFFTQSAFYTQSANLVFLLHLMSSFYIQSAVCVLHRPVLSSVHLRSASLQLRPINLHYEKGGTDRIKIGTGTTKKITVYTIKLLVRIGYDLGPS